MNLLSREIFLTFHISYISGCFVEVVISRATNFIHILVYSKFTLQKNVYIDFHCTVLITSHGRHKDVILSIFNFY